ncbi:MAG: hypothetical protein SPI77_07480 [Corynebacterium sp.]|nr:hypothetical protein [Corynebacterium sp.]
MSFDNPQQPGFDNPQNKRMSTGMIFLLAVILVAVFGIAIGAGIGLLGNRDSDTASASSTSSSAVATPTTSTVTETPSATPETQAPAVATTGDCHDLAVLDHFAPASVMYCDGQWLHVGKLQTDRLGLFSWTGTQWSRYEHDGTTLTGFGCYDRAGLVQAGAPEELIGDLLLCEPESAAPAPARTQVDDGDFLSYAACRGEYALIVESVLINPGDMNYQQTVLNAIARHPGSTSTYPGVCQAFRSTVNGQTIYPIYIDYGSDLAGACAAEYRGEGNARRLVQSAEWSSPCPRD